jgi:hypothetical protein
MWRGKLCCRESESERQSDAMSLAAAASTRWFDGVGEKKELASEARAPEVPGEHLLTKSRLAAR